MKTNIETAKAPLPGTMPYSQAIAAGNMIFTAGQIPMAPDGTMKDGSIEEAVRQVMENLKAVLAAAGADFSDVVKTTIYITDMSVYPKVNEVYAGYMGVPYPARETVCVAELPKKSTVEISMVAVKG